MIDFRQFIKEKLCSTRVNKAFFVVYTEGVFYF